MKRNKILQIAQKLLADFFGKPEEQWAVLVMDRLVYIMTSDDKVVTPESLERFLDEIGAVPYNFDGMYCLQVIKAQPDLVLFAFFSESLEQHTGETQITTGEVDPVAALEAIRHGPRRR